MSIDESNSIKLPVESTIVSTIILYEFFILL